MTRALVLFAHGARAASWAVPFERLADQARSVLPGVPVSLAFLELMEPRLPEHIATLVAKGISDALFEHDADDARTPSSKGLPARVGPGVVELCRSGENPRLRRRRNRASAAEG